MQFIVPKFIERDPKIVGPFTFKQFVLIAISIAICIFIYFFVPFLVFVVVATFLLGSSFALAVLKIQGVPLPTVIKNFFFYILEPRVYLWSKKRHHITIEKEKISLLNRKKNENKKNTPIKFTKKGKLSELFTNLEIKKQ